MGGDSETAQGDRRIHWAAGRERRPRATSRVLGAVGRPDEIDECLAADHEPRHEHNLVEDTISSSDYRSPLHIRWAELFPQPRRKRLLADPGKQLPEGIVRINIAHPLNTAIHHGAVTADPGAESEQAQRRRLEWRDCPCHHTRPHLTMLLSVLPADHCPGHVPGLDLAGPQAQSGARAIVWWRLLSQGGRNDRSHEVATLRRSEPIDIRRFLPDEPRKLWVFGLGRAAHVRFKCSPVRPGSQPRVYRLGSDWRGTGVVRLAVRRAATAGAHQ